MVILSSGVSLIHFILYHFVIETEYKTMKVKVSVIEALLFHRANKISLDTELFSVGTSISPIEAGAVIRF